MSDDQRNVDASGVTAISQPDDCNETKSAAAGRFPHGFYLGVATSPYQIEGVADEVGKRQPFWDTYAQTSGEIQNGSTDNVAERPARARQHRPEAVTINHSGRGPAARARVQWGYTRPMLSSD